MSSSIPLISDIYKQLSVPECADLVKQIHKTNDDQELMILIEKLFKYQPVFGVNFDPSEQNFWRGRLLQSVSKFELINNLLWPPSPDIISRGRANKAKEAVLYISTHLPTIVSELNAKIGQKLHVISVRPIRTKNLKLYPIGDLGRIATTGSDRSPRVVPLKSREIKLYNNGERVTGMRRIPVSGEFSGCLVA